MKNIQALIFDYDGVIAESNEIKLSAFKELFKDEKRGYPRTYKVSY